MHVNSYVNCKLNCSTVIATCAYQGLKPVKAVTLHKWSGILDGRYTNEELLHLMNTDERYTDIKQRIFNTQCLIIDEMSMISAKTLNQVEFILRNTRNNSFSFGGIQMILCGDFSQLPPVANELYGDQGKHCFNTKFFDQVFPHRVNLHIIYRQTDSLKEAFQMQQRQSYSHWVDPYPIQLMLKILFTCSVEMLMPIFIITKWS